MASREKHEWRTTCLARVATQLLIAEHTHIPASDEPRTQLGASCRRITTGLWTRSSRWPRRAAVTLRIELFTGIALLIQRDPIITAKEAASIDLISGGRFVFGVGAGWNIEELRDHGTDPKTRGALLDERIEAIKALWTDEPAEYHGKYVDFDASYSGPSRCRQPHPPIFIGGDSDATVNRVIRHDAGWISNPSPVEHMRNASTRCARAPAKTSDWQRSARPEPDSWHALDDLGFTVVWRCCCPPYRRTSHCDYSTTYAAMVDRYRG